MTTNARFEAARLTGKELDEVVFSRPDWPHWTHKAIRHVEAPVIALTTALGAARKAGLA